MKKINSCCPQLATNTLEKLTSSVKASLMLLLFLGGAQFNAQAQTPPSPPACNIIGNLESCAVHDSRDVSGDMIINIEVAKSGLNPTLALSFNSNSAGAFIRSIGPKIYFPSTNRTTQQIVVFPGTQGYEYNLELDVTNIVNGLTCECSKSVTIDDVQGTTSFTPILCYGGTSQLTVVGSAAESATYTYTLEPGGATNTTGIFPGLLGDVNYTVTIVSGEGCVTQVSQYIPQPAYNPVVLHCPENSTHSSCFYANQDAVNTAFNDWLGSFYYDGGTHPSLTINPVNPVAPALCGGQVAVTWTVTSDCEPFTTSCTKTFTVTAPTELTATCSQDPHLAACSSGDVIAAAYAAWVNGFHVNGGCNPNSNIQNIPSLSSLGCGGQLNFTLIADNAQGQCPGHAQCSSTFTVENATPVTFTCGTDVNIPSCSDQSTVDAAFAAFLSSTTASGGCNGHLTNDNQGSPAACGGSTTVTWFYTSSCDEVHSCTRTFTVAYPADIVFTCAEDKTVANCKTQAEVNAEFQAWLGTASGTGGCGGQFSYGEPTAPSYCGGNTDVTFTYTAAGYMRSGNLVSNGDFSAGPSDFNSGYYYVSPVENANTGGYGLYPEGYYAVDADASVYHPNFAGHDHTSGTGPFFMIINGSGTPNTQVWSQTVTGITPNTNYSFSTWVTSVNPQSLALLNFSINGTQIGPVFAAPATVGTWTQFQTTWNSGSSTSAFISIVNQNTVLGGNDFGLDDISFAPSNGTCEIVTNTCTKKFTVPALPEAQFAAHEDITVSCGSVVPSELSYSGCLQTGTVTSTLSAIPGACGGDVTESWIATDACQRTIHASRIIHVLPAAAPVFAQVGDITVACGGATTSELSYNNGLQGACNISGTVTSTLSNIPDVCGGDVTESWTATDACQRTIHASRIIHVLPAAAPVFAQVGAITVSCGGATTSQLSYSNGLQGACNISGMVTSTLGTLPGACGGDVVESWDATYCGHLLHAERIIHVSPATAPAFAQANAITVRCGEATTSQLNYTNGLQGNCNISGTVTSTLSTIPGACGGDVVESWDATYCGHSLHKQRIIHVQPTLAPVFAPVSAITVSCGEATTSQLSYNNGLQGYCNISGTVTSTLSTIPGACGGDVVESWNTTYCGTPLHAERVIHVLPATAPVFASVGAITVSCGGATTSELSYSNGLEGNCNISGTVTSTLSTIPGACGGDVVESWDATYCGHSLHTQRIIHILPATAPVFTVVSAITVANGQATTSELSYSNGLQGYCNISGTVTSTLSALPGSTIPGACGGDLLESWDATYCGHTLHTERIIHVLPALPPVFTQVGPITVGCGEATTSELSYTNGLLGTSNISGTVTSTLSAIPGACGGDVVESWDATYCNHPLHAERIIHILPAAAPVFTQVSEITVACGGAATSELSYSNGLQGYCNISGSVTSTLSTIPGACGGDVVESWDATYCGHPLHTQRTIHVLPATLPVLTAPAGYTIAACGTMPEASRINFTNGLSGACELSGTSNLSTFSNVPLCGGVITETWTAIDACGRQLAPVSRTITVNAPDEVTFTCGTDVNIPSCSDQSTVDAAFAAFLSSTTASGGCNGHLTNDNQGSPAACGGSTTVTWFYTSSCDEVHSCTRTFTVAYPADIVFTCAEDKTVAACQTQAEVNAEFQAWLGTASGTGGCGGQFSYGEPTAPSYCGGNTDVTFTYTASGYMRSGNLVANGDFSAGASDFNSGYYYVSPVENANTGGYGLYPEGYYAVDADASAYHPNFAGHDHTSGTGPFFMIINGSGTPNTQVWSQTVTGITPNTNYSFSTWVTSVNPQSLALLNFSINGTQIGPVFAAPATVGTWTQFQTTWNSGSSTSAFISIVNQNTVLGGNDFGLDDISFAPSNGTCETVTNTCTKKFTVMPSTPVTFTCGSDVNIEACSDQATVNAAYAAFVESTTASGGCNGHLSNNAPESAPLACGGSVDVTWTYTSSCDQPYSCTKTFSVTPATRVLFSCGSDVTIPACSDQSTVNAAYAAFIGSTTASGGCNGSLNNNAPEAAPLACGGSVDVTWTYTSACEEQHVCTKTFSVTPSPAVHINCPADLTVNACQTQAEVNAQFDAWVATATANGGCSGHLSNDGSAPSACGGNTTVTFTYTSTCEPYTTTCSANFTVRTATFTAPANTTIYTDANCGYNASTSITGLPVITGGGNCSATFTDDTITPFCTNPCSGPCTCDLGSCPGSHTIIRTWHFVDACGTEIPNQTQTITIRDNTPPTFTAPANITINWTANCDADVDPAVTGDVTDEHDNCSVCINATYTDVLHFSPCQFRVTRTWRLVDLCGNQAAPQVQTITILDNTPPTIACAPNKTLACNEAIVFDAPSASDNCGSNPTVTVLIADNVVGNVHTRTWLATDACGNTATCSQSITVTNGTPPTISCPAAVTVSCASQVPAPNTASVTASAGAVVTFEGDVISNQTCVNRYTITRTYKATGACGTPATCTQTITVNDVTAPSITCSPNKSIACNATVTFDAPTASDNCSGTPAISVLVSDNVVGNVHTRTWLATDACGNTATCSQSVTVNGGQLTLGTCSHTNASCNSGCNGGNGNTGSVTAGTVSGSSGTLTYTWKNSSNVTVGTTATVSGLAPGTYNLTVTDACSSATCSQTITQPTAMVLGACSHTNLSCNTSCGSNYANSGSVTAGTVTGANGSVSYKWRNSSNVIVGTTATVTGLPVGTYTLTVQDNCGTLTCSQTITQPTAMTLGACSHTDLACNSSCGGNNTGSVTAGTVTGANGSVSYKWRNSSNVIVGTTATVTGLPVGTYTLTVQDNCGTLTCSQTITQPTAMTLGACSHTNLSCNTSCGSNYSNSGSVTAGTVTGANGTVTYKWRNSSNVIVGTTATVTGLPVGTYTLTVQDNCGTLTCSQTITQPSALTLGACSHTDLACNSSCGGNNTGSVTAGTVGNANGTVTYKWRNSSNVVVGTTATVTGLPAGTYTLTVQDNCSSLTCSQTISQPTAMSLGSCSHTDAPCGGTGSVTAGTVTGAVGTVTYSWKNSSNVVVGTTATVTGLGGGTYTLTVRDNCSTLTCCQTIAASTGCSNVTNGGQIGSDQSNCGGFDPATITSLCAPTGGCGNLEYIWLKSTNNFSTSTVIAGATSATYNPGSITCTTWYKRLSRRSNCTQYVGQSNVVKKEVRTNCSCTSSKTDETETGIETVVENNNMFHVSVYPNPFASQFHLKVETSSEENVQVRIYSVLGQLMETKTNLPYQTELTFGEELAKGVYMVEVAQGTKVQVLRIIKTDQ